MNGIRGCFTTIIIGILIFILVVGVILLIAWGLHYVLQFLPCEILVYIETGLLLGVFMLVAMLLTNEKLRTVLLK